MSKEPVLIQISRCHDGKWKPTKEYRSRCPDKKRICNDCQQKRDIATPEKAWCVVMVGGKKV